MEVIEVGDDDVAVTEDAAREPCGSDLDIDDDDNGCILKTTKKPKQSQLSSSEDSSEDE